MPRTFGEPRAELEDRRLVAAGRGPDVDALVAHAAEHATRTWVE
jgi:hypothetical protein